MFCRATSSERLSPFANGCRPRVCVCAVVFVSFNQPLMRSLGKIAHIIICSRIIPDLADNNVCGIGQYDTMIYVMCMNEKWKHKGKWSPNVFLLAFSLDIEEKRLCSKTQDANRKSGFGSHELHAEKLQAVAFFVYCFGRTTQCTFAFLALFKMICRVHGNINPEWYWLFECVWFCRYYNYLQKTNLLL